MSGSGIQKYKSYIPYTKRDSKDVQKQYTTFEFNSKLIKSFEKIPITDNDKLNYKGLPSKKEFPEFSEQGKVSVTPAGL